MTMDPILASAVPEPDACDICRRALVAADAYYRLNIGMDDVPSYLGLPPEASSTVEDMNEVVVCDSCQPRVSRAFDTLVETLWQLRKPDDPTPFDALDPAAAHTEPPPSEPIPLTEKVP
jgi:hypothetical protein